MAGMAFGNGASSIEHAMGHAFGKMFNIHYGCAVGGDNSRNWGEPAAT
jgi:alcohol dehydrogenase class IV